MNQEDLQKFEDLQSSFDLLQNNMLRLFNHVIENQKIISNEITSLKTESQYSDVNEDSASELIGKLQ